VIDLTHYAIPGFIALMLLEATVGAAHMGQPIYVDGRDTRASLAMGVGSVFINLFWKSVVYVYLSALATLAPWKLGYSQWVWAAAIVGDDFCYYWFHRLSHEVRFLWAAHVNHHSSRRYNLSTALRQSWTTPFTSFLFWTPLPLLGFDPAMILTVQTVSLLYQFWIHTEAIGNLGVFERFMNTPSHHRVHHATNVRYLDRNHGGFFIVWDRLFGTFEAEDEAPVYGLTKNIETYAPTEIAFHEWKALAHDVRNAATWREKLGYLLMPPGWSPDGSTKTADELRAALVGAETAREVRRFETAHLA
jgi:sterol desaturase/sphingolipid hydroxylase (fatty acid hydroxylase superfamily)